MSLLTKPKNAWFGTILVFVLATAILQLWQPTNMSLLRWQPSAIEGEWWRLFSGHFTHLSAIHALLNSLALVLVARLFWPDWRLTDWRLMALSLPLTSVLLAFTHLTWYVGLSGVLHGWFLLGAVRLFSVQPKLGLLMLVGLLLKLWLEPYNPLAASEEALIGGNVAYIAHQLGALTMAVLLGLQFLYTYLQKHYL